MGKPEFPAMALAGFYGARQMESYAEACVTHALAEEAKKNCGNCAYIKPMGSLLGSFTCTVVFESILPTRIIDRIKCNDWKEKA